MEPSRNSHLVMQNLCLRHRAFLCPNTWQSQRIIFSTVTDVFWYCFNSKQMQGKNYCITGSLMRRLNWKRTWLFWHCNSFHFSNLILMCGGEFSWPCYCSTRDLTTWSSHAAVNIPTATQFGFTTCRRTWNPTPLGRERVLPQRFSFPGKSFACVKTVLCLTILVAYRDPRTRGLT